MDRKEADHHANQRNPNNIAHKQALDNHANQKNPTSKAYTKPGTAPAPKVSKTR